MPSSLASAWATPPRSTCRARICAVSTERSSSSDRPRSDGPTRLTWGVVLRSLGRSEEHTSELQSRLHLVCRLLLEKKKKTITHTPSTHTHDNTTRKHRA